MYDTKCFICGNIRVVNSARLVIYYQSNSTITMLANCCYEHGAYSIACTFHRMYINAMGKSAKGHFFFNHYNPFVGATENVLFSINGRKLTLGRNHVIYF